MLERFSQMLVTAARFTMVYVYSFLIFFGSKDQMNLNVTC